MKLFVVGNKSSNPDDWSIWDEIKIVIAENEKRAIEVAYGLEPGKLAEIGSALLSGTLVAEIKLDKEQLLISQSEPGWGEDL